jgi:hypothetical protein
MTEVMMNLDQALIDAATDLLVRYFPGDQGIAAAAYTDSGALYTSVVFDPEWGGAGLCAETGAILEAVKRKERVTAIACVHDCRQSGRGKDQSSTSTRWWRTSSHDCDLRQAGRELLLVHGGAETTNEVAEALGHPPQFVTSESGYVSRRTDRRTLEIFEMVYCGQLNKMWVEKLQMAGVNAVGLSGLDGRIFEGTRKDTLRVRIDGKRLVLRDDWTGTVERVNTHLLRTLLDAGYLPVLTPPARRTRARRSTWTATAPRRWWPRPFTPRR